MINSKVLRFYQFVRRAPGYKTIPYPLQYESRDNESSYKGNSLSFGKYVSETIRTPERVIIAQEFLEEKRKTQMKRD